MWLRWYCWWVALSTPLADSGRATQLAWSRDLVAISMKHLLDPSVFEALGEWLAQREVPAYRAAQMRRWLFAGRAESFNEMTNLPKSLREELAAEFTIWTTAIERHHRAADGTEKLLLRLHDGHHIECVLLRDGARRT